MTSPWIEQEAEMRVGNERRSVRAEEARREVDECIFFLLYFRRLDIQLCATMLLGNPIKYFHCSGRISIHLYLAIPRLCN